MTYDLDADATYVAVSDAPVTETRGFGDSITVGLDEEGTPVGVELLMAPGEATDRVLSPLMDAYPDLIVVRDALRRLVLPASA